MSRGTATPERRILVAEAPVRPRLPDGRPDRSRLLPCRVAVQPWIVDRPWLTILVAATYRFDPASTARPIPLEPAPARRLCEGDLVPLRPLVDLTVTGHVEIAALPSGATAPRTLRVGLGERRLEANLDAPAPGRVPLVPPHTRSVVGRALDLRAQPCHDGAAHAFRHAPDFDLSVYQAAVPELRWELGDVTGLHLGGFWADPWAAVEVALPALAPRALVDYTRSSVQRGDVRMFLDGIAFDADSGAVDVTWRGLVETAPRPHRDVDRIVVGWAPPARWAEDPKSTWADCLRELPRGRFLWAIERRDLRLGQEPPPLSSEELAMARYETWGHPDAAEPDLPPEEAAAVAAELTEGRWPRAEVLARHGLDEYAWGVEERAWTQRIAVRDDPGGLNADFAAALRRASDALATPREATITPTEYVALAARLGRGDPRRLLAEAGLGVGGFIRVERRFRERAAADRGFAAELRRLREIEETRLRGAPGGEEGP